MNAILLNGELIDTRHAGVSVYDASVMYGFSVFEMVRTFEKIPFKLREHLDRLINSVKYLGIDLPLIVDDLIEWHEMLIEANKDEFTKDDEIRTFIKVSPGVVPVYADLVPSEMVKPWVMMTALPMKLFTKGIYALYLAGVNAYIPSQRQIPADLLDPKVKNHCRIHYKLADREARKPYDWPILLDPQGFVTESSGANILTIKGNTIYSPEPRNILWGISLQYVLELAECEGLKVKYVNMNPYHVMTSDEVFFTATPFCIMPCTRIQEVPIGSGVPGPITNKLADRWIKREHCDWKYQVYRWDMEHIDPKALQEQMSA